MLKFVENRFGREAVPWIFLGGVIALAVVGIALTIAFGVSGFVVGLNASVPMIVVGGFGALATGMILEDKRYI